MRADPSEPGPVAHTVTIHASHAGQRIDNFLIREMKGVPRSHVYRILRRGEVRVNRGRVRASYRLQEGDVVRIPPVRMAQAPRRPRPPDALIERLRQAVVYRHADVLVLNKPSGVPVHAGSGIDFGVIEALRLEEGPSLELVHRLDRATSGCLLLARSRQALVALQEQMRAGTVDKHYLALVAGRWQGEEHTVSAPLGKNLPRGGERMVEVVDGGKAAQTLFRVRARYTDTSLVEAILATGRTHQIRVHAAHVGHPITGDEKYGDRSVNRMMKGRGLRRLFLHAWRIGFQVPGEQERVEVEAPLPDDLADVLENLERQR